MRGQVGGEGRGQVVAGEPSDSASSSPPRGTLLQPHRKQRMSTIVPPSLELLDGKGSQGTRPLAQVKYVTPPPPCPSPTMPLPS